ncbi:hypothetical protein [Virgibacillus alimentarius]|uniref:hypothetical protein n=1 Tax=Virgibacillus alimentarius TaxID=698769 RepID=UPI00299CF66F|nr:hypothetical protein [Virgibacillus alimentarius]
MFNYFNSPITNVYTESLNRLIMTMNHVGRGYSFEAPRAKILFTQGYDMITFLDILIPVVGVEPTLPRENGILRKAYKKRVLEITTWYGTFRHLKLCLCI